MRELRAGVWHWQAPHPDWTPGKRWPQEVSSDAIDDGERLLLFDWYAWLRGGVTRQEVAEGLRPLLDLPVEVVCPAHEAPTDRAALERALR